MKRFLYLLTLSLLAVWWVTLAGCALPSVSAAERAYALVSGVNAVSRDLLADNFLPTITDMAKLQDPAQYPAFWQGSFPYANGPYSVTALDASDPAAVTLTIVDSQGGAPLDILLVMGRLGNDWLISRMLMDPSPGPAVTVIVQ